MLEIRVLLHAAITYSTDRLGAHIGETESAKGVLGGSRSRARRGTKRV